MLCERKKFPAPLFRYHCELQANWKTPESSQTSSARRSFPKHRKSGCRDLYSGPPVAAAISQSDYLQNGLVLPKDPKKLELLLRDVDAKGLLDIELIYRMRQKESLGTVKQKIVRKIQQNESAFGFEELVREALEAV
jgi:hypothetical protein